MQLCSKCGELAVEENVNNCHEKVCTACGVVIDDAAFNSEHGYSTAASHYHSASAPASRLAGRIVNKSKTPAALTFGLERLHSLCKMTTTSEWESEVAEILKAVYTTKHFKRKEDVATLAGSILYWVLKSKYQKPILLTEVVEYLQCRKRHFSTHLNFFKSWLCKNNINVSASENNQQKEEGISGCNTPKVAEAMIAFMCKNALDDEKQRLIKMTTDTVKLAYSCWLGTGRPVRSIVVASVYFCWKALDPVNRKNASFSTFCSELDINEPRGRKRVSELEELLLKLGQNIPSYSENYITKHNLFFHFNTILQNSETLRFDRLVGKLHKQEINCDEFNTFRTLKRRAPREISKSAVQYDSDMNASDIEIPDSEIDEYINYGVQKKVIQDLCKIQEK